MLKNSGGVRRRSYAADRDGWFSRLYGGGSGAGQSTWPFGEKPGRVGNAGSPAACTMSSGRSQP